MTIENKTSKNISNGELLEDIRFTHLEVNAYSNLAKGFLILSQLPQNIENGKSNYYYGEHKRYLILQNTCLLFLSKLQELKKERGIE